jgi:hypothetical protein
MTRPRTLLKSILLVAVAAIVVCLAVFAWMRFSPRHVPPGQPPLATIRADSVPAFRDTFNAAEGEVRVLAMLSPT